MYPLNQSRYNKTVEILNLREDPMLVYTVTVIYLPRPSFILPFFALEESDYGTRGIKD
jgi:hypothetical protein